MAIHSSILASKILGTEEPDGLQSMGSQRIGHGQARLNINILEISELEWREIGEFNSYEHYICYHGKESLNIME